MSKLTNEQVDALADALEANAAGGERTTFHNYDLSDIPCPGGAVQRTLGVQRTYGLPRARAGLNTVNTSVTFGLAHEDWTDRSFPDRIELVFAWTGEDPAVEMFLVTLTARAIAAHALPKPGTVFTDVAGAGAVHSLSAMPHGLAIFPYMWQDRFRKAEMGDRSVWFMQVVPLFEKESNLIAERGFATFEELLEFDGVSFHDFNRKSHVA